MASTQVKSKQIADGEIKREDINTTETGKAIITKVVAGSNINISSTGIDAGTGDVTVNLSSDVSTNSVNIATGQAYKINSSTVLDETNGADKLDSYHASTFTKIISTDTTYTVKTSGGDFTTIQSAIDSLKSVFVEPGINITIEIDDGIWNITSAIAVRCLCPNQLKIVGKNVYSKTISSVESSSGSAGAWSVILNLDSVTNIAVGDYVLIRGDLTGGTNPLFLAGCHKISNVDTGNNRITIESKTLKIPSMASGAVTGTITVVKTIITSIVSGIGLNNGVKLIDKLIIANETTMSSSYYGITMATRDFGTTYIGQNVGISGFYQGIYIALGKIIADYIVISYAYKWGAQIYRNGYLQARYATVTGCGHGTGGGGFEAFIFGYINADNSLMIGNGTNNAGCSNGYLQVNNCKMYYAGSGIYNYENGTTIANDTECSNHTLFGVFTTKGTIIANNAIANNNTSRGIYATRRGYIKAIGSTATGNGINYSPAANTQGNEFAYIDT